MPKNVENRVADLEKRLDALVRDQNKVNQKAHDVVRSEVQALNKVNQKTHEHIGKLEKRVDKLEKAR